MFYRPDTWVSELSKSANQMVDIAKALPRDARVMIMDEPTAVLGKRETKVLFGQIHTLRAAATAILFTLHKPEELAEVTDPVTIMRDGAIVHTGPGAEIDQDRMASMIGDGGT